MDYSNMSDFEINKRVAELRYADCIELEIFQNTCRGSVADVVSQGVFITSFDFNNPSDAWPIIVENRISIVDPISLDKQWTAFIFEDDVEPEVCHKKPLRAAMIVYLMMQEAKCLKK